MSVIGHLEPAWTRAFLRRTRFLDADFQGDVLAVISMSKLCHLMPVLTLFYSHGFYLVAHWDTFAPNNPMSPARPIHAALSWPRCHSKRSGRRLRTSQDSYPGYTEERAVPVSGAVILSRGHRSTLIAQHILCGCFHCLQPYDSSRQAYGSDKRNCRRTVPYSRRWTSPNEQKWRRRVGAEDKYRSL